MPYYQVDPDVLEEMREMGEEAVSEVPEGEFYEPAETTFDFSTADPIVQAMRRALVENGCVSVECRYDGGYDEGFAYFERAQVQLSTGELPELAAAAKEMGLLPDTSELSGEDLAAVLKDYPLAEAMKQSIDASRSPENWKVHQRKWLESATPQALVQHALENLADTLVSELLGQGFGTGEYSLRGRFRANLRTGLISDLEDRL